MAQLLLHTDKADRRVAEADTIYYAKAGVFLLTAGSSAARRHSGAYAPDVSRAASGKELFPTNAR